MKFKLKLLQIKWYVLEFIKDEAQKCFKDNQSFLRKRSYLTTHTLFALEVSGPPRMTYNCESQ
jgi:hypothetical protein